MSSFLVTSMPLCLPCTQIWQITTAYHMDMDIDQEHPPGLLAEEHPESGANPVQPEQGTVAEAQPDFGSDPVQALMGGAGHLAADGPPTAEAPVSPVRHMVPSVTSCSVKGMVHACKFSHMLNHCHCMRVLRDELSPWGAPTAKSVA